MFTMKPKLWRRKSGRGSTTGLVILATSILAALLLVLNRQYVVDQLSVWQYQPSQDAVLLAERASLNDNGRFLFYANHPAIEDATSFNKDCGRKEMSTAILGCFNGQKIFIYDVTDQRLDGIREVTAAHETLHAAYARLAPAEKSKIDALLGAEYETLKNDSNFAERMAFYERTEPGERNNELHSIIGTEVASVSPELEGYYKKYFKDRNSVVTLHQNYAKVFNDLQKRGEDVAAQLTALTHTIETESAAYNKAVSQLNQDIARFNEQANRGGFSSSAEFQAARAALVTRAEGLEATRKSINDNIAQYDQLRNELTAVSRESEALNKSIDSSLEPTPSL